MPEPAAPPSDYGLLVPREWFRVDLVRDGWRPQLKTFTDHHTSGLDAERRQRLWRSLCAAAEAGVARGGLEFYLLPGLGPEAPVAASLIVSVLPPPVEAVARDALLADLATRHGERAAPVQLDAGPAVAVESADGLDVYVPMPDGVGGCLVLTFDSAAGPLPELSRLYRAIAGSLRWIR
ncbi:hypothetical protein [Streptomyces boninensis]|uniref:hypothetical protein n=1 Tax=Streptomyces boninensis TaxID=2039455 RepID=UPI003B21C793